MHVTYSFTNLFLFCICILCTSTTTTYMLISLHLFDMLLIYLCAFIFIQLLVDDWLWSTFYFKHVDKCAICVSRFKQWQINFYHENHQLKPSIILWKHIKSFKLPEEKNIVKGETVCYPIVWLDTVHLYFMMRESGWSQQELITVNKGTASEWKWEVDLLHGSHHNKLFIILVFWHPSPWNPVVS